MNATSQSPPTPNPQARDINLDIKRVVAYRHWCNKLWNAIKFAMMNLGEGFAAPERPLDAEAPGFPPACRWVLSRLNVAVTSMVQVRRVCVCMCVCVGGCKYQPKLNRAPCKTISP